MASHQSYFQISTPIYSIVVPAYNEEDVLLEFHKRIFHVMSQYHKPWEVIYVDDGSTDKTLPLLKMMSNRKADFVNKEDITENALTMANIRFISLSRNFGKEIALTAGLDKSRGDAIIVIDADLQDPPEVIPDLIQEWENGFDVVYAQRSEREGETWFKKATAHCFYRLMQKVGGKVKLPEDTGDFRLMSRRSLDAVLALREHHRFMKGLFAWVGFPSQAVKYKRAPRLAGTTKWNYIKLINLSIEGITSFTIAPLRMAMYLGLLTGFISLIYGGVIVIETLYHGNPVPGYPSLLTAVLFLGGTQLFALGVVGEYLGRIFNETKQRPLYFVQDNSENYNTNLKSDSLLNHK